VKEPTLGPGSFAGGSPGPPEILNALAATVKYKGTTQMPPDESLLEHGPQFFIKIDGASLFVFRFSRLKPHNALAQINLIPGQGGYLP
jgi:hypothetical protein